MFIKHSSRSGRSGWGGTNSKQVNLCEKRTVGKERGGCQEGWLEWLATGSRTGPSEGEDRSGEGEAASGSGVPALRGARSPQLRYRWGVSGSPALTLLLAVGVCTLWGHGLGGSAPAKGDCCPAVIGVGKASGTFQWQQKLP